MNCDTNQNTNAPKQNNPLPADVPQLISLYFYLTGACNLACRHCWINPEFSTKPSKHSLLPYELIESAVLQAKPLGLQSVKLTGGEPLLHPQFREIVCFLKRNNLFFPIETNGTLIDRDMAQFIADAGSNAFISVSIDGVNAKTHELLRGVEGSFQKTVSAIEYLVDCGIEPQIICTLHKGNKVELKNLVRMAEELGCGSIKFNLIQSLGRGSSFIKDFGLTVPETLELYQCVERDVTPKTQIRICFDVPPAFFPLKRFLQSSLGRCHVFHILGVLHTGQVSLCGIGTNVPELIFGHISDNNLKDIWFNSERLKKLRENIPDNFEGICYECIYGSYCLGSCVASNYYSTKKLNASYLFCEEADRLGLFPATRKKSGEKYTHEKQETLSKTSSY